MIKFSTLQEAFKWAFNEKEDLNQIINDFKLNDEFETIDDVTEIINIDTLENYLLEHSYLVPYENGYAFFEYEDYANNDELAFELAGKLGENEG